MWCPYPRLYRSSATFIVVADGIRSHREARFCSSTCIALSAELGLSGCCSATYGGQGLGLVLCPRCSLDRSHCGFSLLDRHLVQHSGDLLVKDTATAPLEAGAAGFACHGGCAVKLTFSLTPDTPAQHIT